MWQDASRSSSKVPRLKQKYQQADGEYELSRYKPIVQMVMEVSCPVLLSYRAWLSKDVPTVGS